MVSIIQLFSQLKTISYLKKTKQPKTAGLEQLQESW